MELSGGQAKRLMICRALVHRPDVLFLDEPTAGLDPQSRLNLWDLLRGLQAAGQTILLTTHYLEEAEEMCDRVAVIDHGTVLASGTVPELKDSAGADTVITVTFDGAAPDGAAALRARPGVSKVEIAAARSACTPGNPAACSGSWWPAGCRPGSGSATPRSCRPACRPRSSA